MKSNNDNTRESLSLSQLRLTNRMNPRVAARVMARQGSFQCDNDDRPLCQVGSRNKFLGSDFHRLHQLDEETKDYFTKTVPFGDHQFLYKHTQDTVFLLGENDVDKAFSGPHDATQLAAVALHDRSEANLSR